MKYQDFKIVLRGFGELQTSNPANKDFQNNLRAPKDGVLKGHMKFNVQKSEVI